MYIHERKQVLVKVSSHEVVVLLTDAKHGTADLFTSHGKQITGTKANKRVVRYLFVGANLPQQVVQNQVEGFLKHTEGTYWKSRSRSTDLRENSEARLAGAWYMYPWMFRSDTSNPACRRGKVLLDDNWT